MAGHLGTKFKYIKSKKNENVLNTDKNRFLSYVSIPDENGCMNWRGVIGNCGYGQFFLLNKNAIRPHRMSYKYFKGEMSDELFVCHTCDNKICVAPDHLFLGTPKDNMIDMINKDRAIKSKGDIHYKAKLKENDIIKIRDLRKLGKSYSAIAKIYNVHMQTIAAVISGRSWSHVQSKGE